jgi:hypothetical protein
MDFLVNNTGKAYSMTLARFLQKPNITTNDLLIMHI